MTPALFCQLLIIPYATVFALTGSTSHFINPPEEKIPDQDANINSVYRVGDIVNIAWSTPEAVVNLIIHQDNSSLTEVDYLPNSVALTQQSYSWKVTIDGSDGGSKFDLAKNNQFNLQLFKTNGTRPVASSTFFNITNSTADQYGSIVSTSRPPATLAASSPRSSSTNASTTTALPSVASSSARPTSEIPPVQYQDGSSSAPRVPLGAVLGVGVFICVIAALVAYFRLQRKTAQRGSHPSNDPAPQYSSRPYNELQEYPPGYWKAAPALNSSTGSTVHAVELPS
ncbi:hypothetical protein BGZ57DRAFT_958317 [Hyaloscypha finlandica]|nr:hypothetical protein BGZ57DRAFT_958317 [Hyaloscypha finlandica]